MPPFQKLTHPRAELTQVTKLKPILSHIHELPRCGTATANNLLTMASPNFWANEWVPCMCWLWSSISRAPSTRSLCFGRFDTFDLYTAGVCCLIMRRWEQDCKMERRSGKPCVQCNAAHCEIQQVLRCGTPPAFGKSLSRITAFHGKATYRQIRSKKH